MKQIMLLVVAILCTANVIAQELPNKEQSKSEVVQFLEMDGYLLKKEFYDIGKVAGIEFQNIVITDIATGTKRGALRISVDSYSSLGTTTYTGTLDYNEIDGCIKSMEYIQSNILTNIPTTYTECIYKTKDGVSFGAYMSNSRKTPEWIVFVQTKDYTIKSHKHFSAEQIGEVIRILYKSIQNLNENL